MCCPLPCCGWSQGKPQNGKGRGETSCPNTPQQEEDAPWRDPSAWHTRWHTGTVMCFPVRTSSRQMPCGGIPVLGKMIGQPSKERYDFHYLEHQVKDCASALSFGMQVETR